MHVLATLLTYISHATVSVILCEWYHYALINIHVNMLLTVNNFIMMLHLTVTYKWYVLVTPLTKYIACTCISCILSYSLHVTCGTNMNVLCVYIISPLCMQHLRLA